MNFKKRFDLHFTNMQQFGASAIMCIVFQLVAMLCGMFPPIALLTLIPLHTMMCHTGLSLLYSAIKQDKKLIYFKKAGR